LQHTKKKLIHFRFPRHAMDFPSLACLFSANEFAVTGANEFANTVTGANEFANTVTGANEFANTFMDANEFSL
jgi:hypothetical protein